MPKSTNLLTPRERDQILHEVPLSSDILITFADGRQFKAKYVSNVHDAICVLLREEVKKDEKK